MENFSPLCTTDLSIPPLTPLEMRKVQIPCRGAGPLPYVHASRGNGEVFLARKTGFYPCRASIVPVAFSGLPCAGDPGTTALDPLGNGF